MEAFAKWLDDMNRNPMAGAVIGILALVLRLEIDRRARRSARRKAAKRKPA